MSGVIPMFQLVHGCIHRCRDALCMMHGAKCMLTQLPASFSDRKRRKLTMTHVCSFLFLVLSSSIWCTACFVSNSAGGHGTGSALSAVKPNHKVEFRSESGVVTPVTSISDRKNLISSLRTFSVATAVLASVLSSGNNPAEASTSDVDRNYFDKENGFAIDIPLGFSSMPRKKGGGDSLSTGQPVEILLVAQDFLKGASLSIGRSDVPQLLNDFSVPWAGKPINSIADVGTANIVSELLILQVPI